jgi:spore maturation protein A
MNAIWVLLVVASIVAALATGGLEAVTQALFEGAKAAVEISLFLLGIVSLWLGIARIIEESGLIHRLSRAFKPFISRLFRGVPPDHPAIASITLNLLANLFGLGNAATPLGIKAMQDLQTLNDNKASLSPDMMRFLVLNTASIQMIPFSVVGILAQFGSASPSLVVLPTLCATTASAVVAWGILSLFRRWAP